MTVEWIVCTECELGTQGTCTANSGVPGTGSRADLWLTVSSNPAVTAAFGPDRLPLQAVSIRLIPLGSASIRIGCGLGRGQGFSRTGRPFGVDRADPERGRLRRLEDDWGTSDRTRVGPCPRFAHRISRGRVTHRRSRRARFEHPDFGVRDRPWQSEPQDAVSRPR
jgi:hypothetical protein